MWANQILSAQFPGSEWITTAAASAHYNLRNFDEAQELFEDLLERDPHRVEVGAPPTLGLRLKAICTFRVSLGF